jgi:hypothetical protein
MPAAVLEPNKYALIDSADKVNSVIVWDGNMWIPPAGLTPIQLYINEPCQIGDTYEPAFPPGSRFVYVTLGDEPDFESTLPKAASRVQVGGIDNGTLYSEGSVVLGNGITSAYLQFADGTKMYSAIIDGGVF